MLLQSLRGDGVYELTDEQKDFIKAEGNVVLCACPGSGKTFVVAKKMLQYIQRWNRSHQGVAVLSFTNVASDEIENQTKELMPDGFKIEYPHFVGTIDSFINKYILLRFGYLLMSTPQRPTIAIKDLSPSTALEVVMGLLVINIKKCYYRKDLYFKVRHQVFPIGC